MLYWETDSAFIRERLLEITDHSELVYDRKYKHVDYYYKLGCGFDIETSKITVNGLEVAICYHWQFGIENPCGGIMSIGGRSLSTMTDFFKTLDEIFSAKKARLLILDANLNYEFQFCKHFWDKIGIDNKEFFAKDVREPLRILVGKSLFFAEVLGLFGNSLENIADNYCTIKKLKGDLNHDLVRNSASYLAQKEIMYCDNDVKILVQLGMFIFKNFFSKKEKFPLTSISRTRNKIKKKCGKNLRYEKKTIKSWMPEEDDYTVLRTYLFKGGICGTNSRFMNRELQNVYMADYTSDYPAKCFHYKFPMGKCKRVAVNDENIIDALQNNRPFIMKIEFHDLESTSTHSLMSTHKCIDSATFNTMNSLIDNGRIYKCEKATLFLNDIELLAFGFFNESDETAYTFDKEKTKILQMWVFDHYGELPDHVLDVIEEEYKKKATLKKEIKKREKYLEEYGKLDISFEDYMNLLIAYKDSKESVNGIFGMMCTALYLDKLIYTGDVIDEIKDENGNYIYKSYEEAIENLFLYPFWGFWITSYARMVLIDTIIRFPNVIVQYDTDSIYYVDDGSEEVKRLKKYIEEYNKETEKLNIELFGNDEDFLDLGCWDVNKKPFKNFKGLGSKRYMYEDDKGIHVTISGCRHLNVVTYNGELLAEMDFHILANEKNLTDEEIEKVEKTKKRISSLEYQHKKKKVKKSIFEYFENHLEIEKEYANKLCSKYVELDDIIEKCPELKTEVTDYQGNTCTMELSSCVVLNPIGFEMGIRDVHITLYETIQNYIKNHPASDLIGDENLIEEIEKEMKKQYGNKKY